MSNPIETTLAKVRELVKDYESGESDLNWQDFDDGIMHHFPDIAASYESLVQENQELKRNEETQLKLIRILSEKVSSLSSHE